MNLTTKPRFYDSIFYNGENLKSIQDFCKKYGIVYENFDGEGIKVSDPHCSATAIPGEYIAYSRQYGVDVFTAEQIASEAIISTDNSGDHISTKHFGKDGDLFEILLVSKDKEVVYLNGRREICIKTLVEFKKDTIL